LLSTPREGIGLPCEGGHAYKIDGKYYLIYIEWPREGNQRRREICYRADALLGPYERKIIFDDDMGYMNQGIAQGCIFDTSKGEWFAMLFQDHHAVGRIPYVLPVSWEEGWPMPGVDGKAPECFEVDLPQMQAEPLVISDEFDYAENKLAMQWQWNHNPDNTLWSVTERKSHLRLKTGKPVEKGVLQARNTLTQRTEGPSCEAFTKVSIGGLKCGDSAGMVAMQGGFGTVGVRKEKDGSVKLVMTVNGGEYVEQVLEEVSFEGDEIYLKIHFDFNRSVDKAYFFYSEDGMNYKQIGRSLQMRYTLDHFMGYRIGLYCYATEEAGGYAEFDFFRYTKFEE